MNVDRVLSQYHVNSRGWDLSLHSQGSGVDTQPFYLLDYKTQRLDLITVAVDLRNPPPQRDDDPKVMAEVLASAYYAYIKPQQPSLSLADALGSACIHYLMATQTWQHVVAKLHQHTDACAQPILILYGPGPKRKPRVRPAAGFTRHTIAEPSWVLDFCQTVVEHDRARHPEWFRA